MTRCGDGGFVIAMVVGTLDLINSSTGETSTNLPVYSGISPTITALRAGDTYEAAYESPGSYLGLARHGRGRRHHVRHEGGHVPDDHADSVGVDRCRSR
jgi:hypothetical protein